MTRLPAEDGVVERLEVPELAWNTTTKVVELAPRTLLVEVHAELDEAATELLRAELDRKMAETPASLLLVDLTHVTLLSSAAMGLLLELHRRCRVDDRHLVLVGTGRPAVNRPLRIAGLLPLFHTRLTVESALRRPRTTARRSS